MKITFSLFLKILQYNETEKNTIGSIKFVVNKTDKAPEMMKMCRKYYQKGKIYDNGTYDIDAAITESKFFLTLFLFFNPFALRTANTQWSFGCSECNKVSFHSFILSGFFLLFS